jgi:succinoglycan biosynthesis transport protein ExoP
MDRTYTIDELWAAVRRRWKTVALVAGGVLVLSALVILRLPNVYTAHALVMVEPFTPHPDLVAPVIDAQDLAGKVKSVRESVYARSVMAPAIDELKLYPKAREKGMDEALEQFRADTEVHAEGDNSFSITVKGQDPEVAAKAANRLAELYIEGNLQVRAGQVARTRDIIAGKLNEMQHQLSASQAKVAAFKAAHADELPELLEQRYHQRDQLGKQLELESQFRQEAQQRIDLLGTTPYGKDTEVGRLEEQRDDLHAKLAAAQSSLLADHPDVTELQREVAANEARLNSARQRATANDLEMRRMTTALDRGGKRVAAMQADQAKLDKIIAATPLIQGQLAELTSDEDMIKAKTTQLVAKKAEAEITAELETKSGPSEFRVLESAQPASTPASPNRTQFLALALIAALALGAAAAMSQELSDRSLRSETEVGGALSLPVLACIPQLYVAPGMYQLMPMQTQADA